MKLNKRYLILTLFLPVQYLFVQYLSTQPAFIEHYYSKGIYPVISKVLRFLLGWIPFSVGDVIGLLLIFLFLRGIYKLIKNRFRDVIEAILKLTSFLSILYFCFYLFWGLNYFRQPLAENLGIKNSKYSTEELINTTEYIVGQLNKYHFDITENDTLLIKNPYSQKEIYNLSVNAYKELSNDYEELSYEVPSVKNSLVSLMQTYNSTSGYLNPITGEAQVNKLIPRTGYPTTTCHEIAHQIGYSAENEANFVGFLASIYSKDTYFNYSGYRMAFSYSYSELRKRDPEASKVIWNTLNKGVKKDYRNSYEFWQQYRNPIEPYIKKGYNSYLKANKQTKGIASYNYVVDLLINYFNIQKS